jgi:hypothetical protein
MTRCVLRRGNNAFSSINNLGSTRLKHHHIRRHAFTCTMHHPSPYHTSAYLGGEPCANCRKRPDDNATWAARPQQEPSKLAHRGFVSISEANRVRGDDGRDVISRFVRMQGVCLQCRVKVYEGVCMRGVNTKLAGPCWRS